MGTAQTLQSLWVSSKLSLFERLCVRLYHIHDHIFHLYSYDPELDLSLGAQLFNAASIVAADQLFTAPNGYGGGSFAVLSDFSHYELLHRCCGWWVDTNVVCLSAGQPGGEVFFALEANGRVNCAVLNFPPAAHPAMRDCRDSVTAAGAGVEWADTGPDLLTSLLTRNGLSGQASSPETRYPLDRTQFPDMCDPAR